MASGDPLRLIQPHTATQSEGTTAMTVFTIASFILLSNAIGNALVFARTRSGQAGTVALLSAGFSIVAIVI
jgi:hypothetical protein